MEKRKDEDTKNGGESGEVWDVVGGWQFEISLSGDRIWLGKWHRERWKDLVSDQEQTEGLVFGFVPHCSQQKEEGGWGGGGGGCSRRGPLPCCCVLIVAVAIAKWALAFCKGNNRTATHVAEDAEGNIILAGSVKVEE